MFKIKCKCGVSEKNFKFDIGPFFMGECCEAAGLDDSPFGEVEAVVETPNSTATNSDASIENPTNSATITDVSIPATTSIDLSDADDLELEDELTPEEIRIQEIVTAIGMLEPNEFNKIKGDPNVVALENILEFNITAAERDQAWAIYQEQNAGE